MNIVLVDDSELDLMINKKIIEMNYNGTQVSSFGDSDKFFEYVEDCEEPDLVISDMQMPKTSGLELANRFINRFGEGYSKLILLTAFVDDSIRKQVEEVSDKIHLIEKPLNPRILKDLFAA